MHQRLVGVHHLLQVDGLVAIVGKGSVFVEIFVGLDDFFHRGRCLDDCCTEYASCKVATIGDEVDVCIQITLYLRQRLADLSDVLMLERLVDAQVVVTPREMCGGSWLLTGTCGTRNGIHCHVLFQQIQIRCGQQGHLNTSGKASWIRYMLRFRNLLTINLRQPIHIVVIALNTEILC